jgi:glycine dehydrogenase
MTTVHTPTTTPALHVLHPSHFAYRHIGPRRADVGEMLAVLGHESIEELIDAVVPEEIRLRRPLALPPGRSEREVLQALRGLAGMNRVFRSYIGMGYAGCFTPQVVQRNVMENPGWYTAYTPYQAEISQGRLEALLNYQTVVSDLTGLEIANASLLDEATAAAEAMALTLAVSKVTREPVYLVDEYCHPQTISVVQTRAEARGIRVVVGEPETFTFEPGVIGALLLYPATDGAVRDFRSMAEAAKAAAAARDRATASMMRQITPAIAAARIGTVAAFRPAMLIRLSPTM